MKHKWDRKIDKRHRFATCIQCGMSKQVDYPCMIYFPANAKSGKFYFEAGDCKGKKILKSNVAPLL